MGWVSLSLSWSLISCVLFDSLSMLWLATMTSWWLCLLLWAALSLALEVVFIIIEGSVVMEKSPEVRERVIWKEKLQEKIRKSGKYGDYGTAKQIWTCLLNFLCYIVGSEYETVAHWQHIFWELSVTGNTVLALWGSAGGKLNPGLRSGCLNCHECLDRTCKFTEHNK